MSAPLSMTPRMLHHLVRKGIQQGVPVIQLPAGIHHVNGTELPESHLWISNNDSGIKPILFDLDGAQNLILDGQGAKFIVDGVLIPLLLRNAKNVTVRNLTIDWLRPGFTEVVVTRSGAGFFELDPAGQLAAEAGGLVALGGADWPRKHLYNALSFDRDRAEPLARSTENWGLRSSHKAVSLPGGTIRVEADLGWVPPPEMPLVLMHGDRVAPAVIIDRSENVTLEEVTIHHALGMGVIAQISRNVTLHKVRVVPSPGRLFSTWVDATHFVDCSGSIRLLDCEFRGMFDDGSNIHGAHRQVVNWLGKDRVLVEAKHPQQVGIPYLQAGDLCELADLQTLSTVGQARVMEVTTLNSRLQELRLENAPCGLEGRVLAIRRDDPEQHVEIRGCTIGANRGRALLLSTPGRIDVHGNRLHSSGNAIEVPPDASYWWESGPVDSLRIENNLFDACGYAMCGTQILRVTAPEGREPLHGEIVVRENEIRLVSNTMATAQRVAHLEFRNNQITKHPGYPWFEGPRWDLLDNGETFLEEPNFNSAHCTPDPA